MTTPLLSYIVLSYNYQDYIKVTIQSILDQTVQDFEIIVVDDGSTDGSCDVVRSFNDPRIRLVVNEKNLGGAGAYNVAVSSARGEWLVNLDADDWIAPEKSELQLRAAAENPQADIIGTWVKLVGADGNPHPDASVVEPNWNGDIPLNLVDTWIGENHLCRSSTMVRREAHLRIGLDDVGMVAAPDYELWTRAFAQGCRFHLVKEPLTFSRLHSRGVTRANLIRSFLEISYALSKNLVPYLEKQGLTPNFVELLRWIGTSPEIAALTPSERHRLFGLLMSGQSAATYADFRALLSKPDPLLESIGRRALYLSAHSEPKAVERPQNQSYIAKLEKDIDQYIEARDYFKAQYDALANSRLGTGAIARMRGRLSRLLRPSGKAL